MLREEVKIEIRTLNDRSFHGNLTTHVSKHLIYKDKLGYPFCNFQGKCFGFKGIPVIMVMFKDVINADELVSMKEFSFETVYQKAGK